MGQVVNNKGQVVTQEVKFKGIDRFNRPVFKALDKPEYYGSVHILFSFDATEYDVLSKVNDEDLCYFGSRFDCEPYGTEANVTIIRSSNV